MKDCQVDVIDLQRKSILNNQCVHLNVLYLVASKQKPIFLNLQVVGLNLRDLLAEVDNGVQNIPESAQKEVGKYFSHRGLEEPGVGKFFKK